MNHQSSTDYDVDNRYSGTQDAVDDEQGKRAAARSVAQRRLAQRSAVAEDRREDDRFIVSGPGDSTYSFRNAYGAPRSPSQRRLERLNQ
jgi:hypothetical protein